ncbi:MAG: FHA domain-containing protein [Pseudomonas sp.]
MKSPIFIEVLARNGAVLHRQRFQQLPVRIGRAYASDLILDDPHVAPYHAVLEEHEGQLILRCGDTRNGIIVNKRAEDQVEMQGHAEVRVGHTRIRVRGVDHPVAEELPDTTRHGWEGFVPALSGLLVIALVAFGDEWLGGDSASEFFSLLSGAFFTLLLALMWTALWALINRLLTGGARFGRHLFIASMCLLLFSLLEKAPGMLAYRLSWSTLDRHSDLSLLAPVALAVYFHLVTISPRLSQRIAVITAGLYLVATGMLLTSNYADTGTLASKAYMDAPYPPGLRNSQLSTVEAFIARTNESEKRLLVLRENAEP